MIVVSQACVALVYTAEPAGRVLPGLERQVQFHLLLLSILICSLCGDDGLLDLSACWLLRYPAFILAVTFSVYVLLFSHLLLQIVEEALLGGGRTTLETLRLPQLARFKSCICDPHMVFE